MLGTVLKASGGSLEAIVRTSSMSTCLDAELNCFQLHTMRNHMPKLCKLFCVAALQTFAKNIAQQQRDRVLLSRRVKAEALHKDSLLQLTRLLGEAVRIRLLPAGSSETVIADVLRTIQLESAYKNDEEEENESSTYRTQQHNTEIHSLEEAISVRYNHRLCLPPSLVLLLYRRRSTYSA